MRVTLLDGRQLVGRFMAFDRHMNVVLGETEEFRRLPPKKGVSEADRELRRPLGLVLIRGEEVISLTVEGPPPSDDRRGKREVAPARCSGADGCVHTLTGCAGRPWKWEGCRPWRSRALSRWSARWTLWACARSRGTRLSFHATAGTRLLQPFVLSLFGFFCRYPRSRRLRSRRGRPLAICLLGCRRRGTTRECRRLVS